VTKLTVVSLGAGVQSTTMVLMAAAGDLVPMPDAAIFADTQAEPEAVYSHLRWLMSGVLPFQVHCVTAGNLTEHVAAVRPKGKYLKVDIPVYAKAPDGSVGLINRSCTRDFKIRPITAQIRKLVGRDTMLAWRRKHKPDLAALREYERWEMACRKAKKLKRESPPLMAFPGESWSCVQEDALVEQWIGISRDEADRMKRSREPWIRSRWPLIERGFSRTDCLRWMERRQYPRPPKSSCVFCPYHGVEQWRALTPDEMNLAIDVDRRLRSRPPEAYRAKGILFLHRSCQPLESVDFGADNAPQWEQAELFSNECEGMCGV
jgi:hypothetical protein